MRPSRSLRRLLFLGVTSAVLALFAINGLVVYSLSRRLQVFSKRPPADLVERLRACARDPASWRTWRYQRVAVDVFDAQTLVGAGETTLALDHDLVARWRAGESAPSRKGWIWGSGTTLLARVGDYGPCSLAQARIAAPPYGLTVIVAGLLALLSGGLGAGAGFVLFVRPLERQLARVRQRAEALERASGSPAPSRELSDLEAIVDSLEAGAQRQREAAASLVQRTAQFERHVSEVAHDVRTPLTGLQLAVERLSEPELEPSERQRVALRILAMTLDLGELLDNIEMASQLKAGLPAAAKREVFDLGATVARVLARFELLAQRQGIECELALPDGPVPISGVHLLVDRGLQNLLHNALRHGGKHVAVVLETHARGFALTLVDDGPGLPDALLETVRTTRGTAEGVARRDGSRGLGLAIANEAMHRSGLRVTYANEPGAGLKVVIEGAVHAAPEGAAPAES